MTYDRFLDFCICISFTERIKDVLLQAEVEICVEPLVKDCDLPGEEVCSTEYTSECETTQHPHQVPSLDLH